MRSAYRSKILSAKIVLLLTMAILLASCLTEDTSVRLPPPQEITDAMSCGLCGMFPANSPQWQSQIIIGDDRMVPFDGCKDMFRYILLMDKYGYARSRGIGTGLEAVWVKDFRYGNWLDGRTAWFVIGSSVQGPMGREIIPFSREEEALLFQKEHGGTIGRYRDINAQTIKSLGTEAMSDKVKGRVNL